ncbi:DUF6978 family protein [Viscerimonas tarda]
MNITNEQADYLLKLPKKIIGEEGELLSQIAINQIFPFKKRFELSSEIDNEFTFLWQIEQGSKDSLRISLHLQEDDSKIGLLRIDYNRGHTNPQTINEYTPEKFHPYAGIQLVQSHIHYYIQGYQPLAWAIPLTDDEFEIKEIDENNFNATFANIIRLFAKAISVETVITINTLLL